MGGENTKNTNAAVTWEGCSVLLDINDGDRLVFARLSPAATVKIGDKNLSLKPLVGCPFGTLFHVVGGPSAPQLARLPSLPPASSIAPTASEGVIMEKEDCQSTEIDCSKDNRSLLDNNSAQSLTSDDIETLRRDGMTGNEIIEALIANSSTFEKKTVFSQEKYKLRKQKKYAPKVLLRRPSARSIGESYFKKHPMRIGFMRIDALSLLLSISNVHASSDVLVVDKVGGLLTGAIAERLGSAGQICNTYFGERPYSLDIVKIFNFSADMCSRIVQAPFTTLSNAQGIGVRDGDNDSIVTAELLEDQENAKEAPVSSKCMPSNTSHFVESSQEDTVMEEISHTNLEVPTSASCRELCSDGVQRSCLQFLPRKSPLPGRDASPQSIKLWKERGFNGLLIAAPDLDAETIVPALLPLLCCSTPFAIYHQYLQPLANCMHKLRTTKAAINLQISEPWLREYQVLPSRTHPHMQMNAFGGYILSGISISGDNPVQ